MSDETEKKTEKKAYALMQLWAFREPKSSFLASITAALAAEEERGFRRGVEACIGVVSLVPTAQRLELAEVLRDIARKHVPTQPAPRSGT